MMALVLRPKCWILMKLIYFSYILMTNLSMVGTVSSNSYAINTLRFVKGCWHIRVRSYHRHTQMHWARRDLWSITLSEERTLTGHTEANVNGAEESEVNKAILVIIAVCELWIHVFSSSVIPFWIRLLHAPRYLAHNIKDILIGWSVYCRHSTVFCLPVLSFAM